MRALFLSQYYDPEPNFKGQTLGCGLIANGHQVSAITGFPNYPDGKLYPGYRVRWRKWEQREGVRVLRLPLYPSHDKSIYRRIANYGSFAVSASVLGPLLCRSADVMWVYHPPLTVGFPAMWISWLRRIPFIFEVQDMWPETLAATGMLPSPRVSAALASLARQVYRRAAAITVISPGFKRNLVGKGVPADKIHVIPNWADEAVYHPVPRDEALAARHGLACRFNVIFAGNLGAAQALSNVLEAAELLRDLPEVQFVFVGDGIEEAWLRQAAAERRLDNVRFMGRFAAGAMPHLFALAGALLVHLKRDPLFEITIPSKTIAYLACGRPIICAVAGDAAEVVRQAGAGIACRPEDPQALAAAVRQMHAMPAGEREALGRAGRNAFLANYTQEVLIKQYELLFTEVARNSGRRR